MSSNDDSTGGARGSSEESGDSNSSPAPQAQSVIAAIADVPTIEQWMSEAAAKPGEAFYTALKGNVEWKPGHRMGDEFMYLAAEAILQSSPNKIVYFEPSEFNLLEDFNNKRTRMQGELKEPIPDAWYFAPVALNADGGEHWVCAFFHGSDSSEPKRIYLFDSIKARSRRKQRKYEDYVRLQKILLRLAPAGTELKMVATGVDTTDSDDGWAVLNVLAALTIDYPIENLQHEPLISKDNLAQLTVDRLVEKQVTLHTQRRLRTSASPLQLPNKLWGTVVQPFQTFVDFAAVDEEFYSIDAAKCNALFTRVSSMIAKAEDVVFAPPMLSVRVRVEESVWEERALLYAYQHSFRYFRAEQLDAAGCRLIWIERTGTNEWNCIAVSSKAGCDVSGHKLRNISTTAAKRLAAVVTATLGVAPEVHSFEYASFLHYDQILFFLSTGNHKWIEFSRSKTLPNQWLGKLFNRDADRLNLNLLCQWLDKPSDDDAENIVKCVAHMDVQTTTIRRKWIVSYVDSNQSVMPNSEERLTEDKIAYSMELRFKLLGTTTPEGLDWILLAANFLEAESLGYKLDDCVKHPFMTKNQWREQQFDDCELLGLTSLADRAFTEAPEKARRLALQRRISLGSEQSMFKLLEATPLPSFIQDIALEFLLNPADDLPRFVMPIKGTEVDNSDIRSLLWNNNDEGEERKFLVDVPQYLVWRIWLCKCKPIDAESKAPARREAHDTAILKILDKIASSEFCIKSPRLFGLLLISKAVDVAKFVKEIRPSHAHLINRRCPLNQHTEDDKEDDEGSPTPLHLAVKLELTEAIEELARGRHDVQADWCKKWNGESAYELLLQGSDTQANSVYIAKAEKSKALIVQVKRTIFPPIGLHSVPFMLLVAFLLLANAVIFDSPVSEDQLVSTERAIEACYPAKANMSHLLVTTPDCPRIVGLSLAWNLTTKTLVRPPNFALFRTCGDLRKLEEWISLVKQWSTAIDAIENSTQWNASFVSFRHWSTQIDDWAMSTAKWELPWEQNNTLSQALLNTSHRVRGWTTQSYSNGTVSLKILEDRLMSWGDRWSSFWIAPDRLPYFHQGFRRQTYFTCAAHCANKTVRCGLSNGTLQVLVPPADLENETTLPDVVAFEVHTTPSRSTYTQKFEHHVATRRLVGGTPKCEGRRCFEHYAVLRWETSPSETQSSWMWVAVFALFFALMAHSILRFVGWMVRRSNASLDCEMKPSDVVRPTSTVAQKPPTSAANKDHDNARHSNTQVENPAALSAATGSSATGNPSASDVGQKEDSTEPIDTTAAGSAATTNQQAASRNSTVIASLEITPKKVEQQTDGFFSAIDDDLFLGGEKDSWREIPLTFTEIDNAQQWSQTTKAAILKWFTQRQGKMIKQEKKGNKKKPSSLRTYTTFSGPTDERVEVLPRRAPKALAESEDFMARLQQLAEVKQARNREQGLRKTFYNDILAAYQSGELLQDSLIDTVTRQIVRELSPDDWTIIESHPFSLYCRSGNMPNLAALKNKIAVILLADSHFFLLTCIDGIIEIMDSLVSDASDLSPTRLQAIANFMQLYKDLTGRDADKTVRWMACERQKEVECGVKAINNLIKRLSGNSGTFSRKSIAEARSWMKVGDNTYRDFREYRFDIGPLNDSDSSDEEEGKANGAVKSKKEPSKDEDVSKLQQWIKKADMRPDDEFLRRMEVDRAKWIPGEFMSAAFLHRASEELLERSPNKIVYLEPTFFNILQEDNDRERFKLALKSPIPSAWYFLPVHLNAADDEGDHWVSFLFHGRNPRSIYLFDSLDETEENFSPEKRKHKYRDFVKLQEVLLRVAPQSTDLRLIAKGPKQFHYGPDLPFMCGWAVLNVLAALTIDSPIENLHDQPLISKDDLAQLRFDDIIDKQVEIDRKREIRSTMSRSGVVFALAFFAHVVFYAFLERSFDSQGAATIAEVALLGLTATVLRLFRRFEWPWWSGPILLSFPAAGLMSLGIVTYDLLQADASKPAPIVLYGLIAVAALSGVHAVLHLVSLLGIPDWFTEAKALDVSGVVTVLGDFAIEGLAVAFGGAVIHRLRSLNDLSSDDFSFGTIDRVNKAKLFSTFAMLLASIPCGKTAPYGLTYVILAGTYIALLIITAVVVLVHAPPGTESIWSLLANIRIENSINGGIILVGVIVGRTIANRREIPIQTREFINYARSVSKAERHPASYVSMAIMVVVHMFLVVVSVAVIFYPSLFNTLDGVDPLRLPGQQEASILNAIIGGTVGGVLGSNLTLP